MKTELPEAYKLAATIVAAVIPILIGLVIWAGHRMGWGRDRG